jgi:hypothetical protein
MWRFADTPMARDAQDLHALAEPLTIMEGRHKVRRPSLRSELDMRLLWTKSTLLCLGLAGCGVPSSRVDALEAQIAQLKSPASGGDDVQARIDAAAAKYSESLGKMEEMLEVLQREVTRVASEGGGGSTKSGGGGDAAMWTAVEAALGVEGDGLNVDGDTYTIKHAWLSFHLEALAENGKATKLGETKDGVQLRGVRPHTLPSSLGLKNGDVVTSVGGTKVNTTKGLLEALKSASSPLQVVVMRKKAEVTFTYRLVD